MKSLKVVGITLIALLLTGCYTQLQYSQTMREITDQEEKQAKAYSWNDDEQTNEKAQIKGEAAQRSEEYSDSAVADEEYIPIPYRDYQYADKYEACNCNPYNSYHFYGDSYFFPSYGSWYNYHRSRFGIGFTSSAFYRWHMRQYFGHSFTLGFSWGYDPFGYYYDPFGYPFYDYYGYHRPYAFNYYYFYGKSGYGPGYYNDGKSRTNIRYGPRNVGADRVVTNRNRSGDSQVRSRSSSNDGSRQAVRTRSVGTSRSSGTVNRNSSGSTRVTRSRSSNNGGKSGSARTRSRGNENEQDNSRDQVYIDRTDEPSTSVIISGDRYREIRSRQLSNSSVRTLENSADLRSHLRTVQDKNTNSRIERNRPTFFERMKSFFDNNSSRIIKSRSTNSPNRIRSRSTNSGRSSSVGQSSSGSSRSSVTRSRSSSSSSSKSRGSSSSSSSRSRSGGGNSSGSERSRGN